MQIAKVVEPHSFVPNPELGERGEIGRKIRNLVNEQRGRSPFDSSLLEGIDLIQLECDILKFIKEKCQ